MERKTTNINYLPKGMAECAVWARRAFYDGARSEMDGELVTWVWSDSDGNWYSILGNYSQFSPSEKEERYKAKEKSVQELAKAYYDDVIYRTQIREEILQRDNYTCQLCEATGNTKLHVHHILKRIEGGGDYFDNLITVCPSCHHKADRSLYNPEWELPNL